MKITLKDGSSKEYSEAKSVYEIAKDISEGLARVACAGEVDGEIVDLRTVLDKDCTLNIITASDEEGLRVIRHTASHVLAQAVKNLFPDAKITIGPAIDDGFYYDFDSQPFSREDLDALEAEMKKIIKQGHEITRFTLPREEAIKFMKEKDEPYKVELCQEHAEKGEPISFYQQDEFVDLCAGPHLMATGTIKAFKLLSCTGAYWRGSEKNKMLSRVYAVAFPKAAMLEEHLAALEEVIGERAAEYRGKEGSLIQVLHMAQGIYGYLPIEVQRVIADTLDIPLAEVAGVVTFYSFFSTQPRGRHTIRVCLGTACYVRGGKKIVERIKELLDVEIGETTKDRLFTFEVARCIGACGLAPAMSIDDQVYKQVNPDKLEQILKRYYEED